MKMTTFTWLALAAVAFLLWKRSSGGTGDAKTTVNPRAVNSWMPWAPTGATSNDDVFAQATTNYTNLLQRENFFTAPPGKSSGVRIGSIT